MSTNHDLQSSPRKDAGDQPWPSSSQVDALRGALQAFAGSQARQDVKHSVPSRANTSNVPTSRGSQIAGNVSTTTAASRFSQRVTNAQPLQRSSHAQLSSPEAEMRRDDQSVESAPINMNSAKGYFEALQRPAISASAAGPTTGHTQPTMPAKPQRVADRPKLSVDVVAAVADQGWDTESLPLHIHSPKPVRPTSTAAPLETVATQNAPDEQATVRPMPFSAASAQRSSKATISKPEPPPPRRVSTALAKSLDDTSATTKPTDTSRRYRPPISPLKPPGSASDALRSKSAELLLDRSRRGSPQALTMEQINAHRVDTLANAMIAGSLASSRAPSRMSSPAKASRPALSRRQTEDISSSYPPITKPFANMDGARTPSPRKGFRQTMRKPVSIVDQQAELAEKHKRSHFHMRKHPNKHHEGSRRRWRDEITIEEVKRYEGLWAANRDLFSQVPAGSDSPPSTNGCVGSLVVRDIWLRSRLPLPVLEEIWDLVDREGNGLLNREAFVVGTWLVDQRLKGRKLPVKVGDSVWLSARGMYGLKMPKH